MTDDIYYWHQDPLIIANPSEDNKLKPFTEKVVAKAMKYSGPIEFTWAEAQRWMEIENRLARVNDRIIVIEELKRTHHYNEWAKQRMVNDDES